MSDKKYFRDGVPHTILAPLIGHRAKELSLGAHTELDKFPSHLSIDIAIAEYNANLCKLQGVIPLKFVGDNIVNYFINPRTANINIDF